MAAECALPDCLSFFDGALETLRRAFREIETVAPKPVLHNLGGTRVFRYLKPTLHLALLLKLGRMISMLGALRSLIALGYIQEQGMLQRALDETLEDIVFLAFADQDGVEKIHLDFLEAFWAEEFHDPEIVLNHKRRTSIPRRRISARNSRNKGSADPSTAQSVDRLLQGVFSGYVHGAAPHILDLYDPLRRQLGLSGVTFAPVREGYIIDAANYPYRTILAGVLVSRRLGFGVVAEDLATALHEAGRFIELPSDEEAKAIMARMKGKKAS